MGLGVGCDTIRMENDHGDLADVVRAGGRSGPSNTEFDPVAEWQVPSEPVFVPTRTETPTNSFGDPFLNLRDPLLNQYIGAELFEGAEAMVAPASMAVASSSGHGGEERLLATPKVLTGGEQEIKGPCTIFSRVLQISPVAGNTKPSPLPPRLITPPPVGAGEMMMMKMSSGSIAEPVDNDGGVQISSPRTPGIKRRKSQAKKVVCIPAPAAASNRSSGEVVPSDLWAWRKYGQKPIKGSPYPRGYYRCSSSKGCSARKQVERCRTDPNMLVITYTSEHNHPWPTQRNALAGSIRFHPSKTASRSSGGSILKSPTAPKEETQEAATMSSEADEMGKTTEQAEDTGFHQIIHPSYKPTIPEADQPDDLFAYLAELEADPLSLILSKGFTETKPEEGGGDGSMDDPFNMLDWAGSS
ncbi:WRKY [Musa troglodytarum]|uniref:WRKY n=3 Tax=Musa troglodytarum TaxID=320322 RepID=A0A9E7G025_9LILI|nr:WRKY [Musa troglodytarum]